MNVQEWGCFSIFLRADDVTRTMSKGGGVLVKNPVSAPGHPPPPPFKNPGSAPVVAGEPAGFRQPVCRSYTIGLIVIAAYISDRDNRCT